MPQVHWKRPSRLAAISLGLVGAAIGICLEHYGVSWKYSETGFGSLLLVWGLVSLFRPEWHRPRFWLVVSALLILHLIGWMYLARRIVHFGFALMFVLVVVEIMLGAWLILKAIPEDNTTILKYIGPR